MVQKVPSKSPEYGDRTTAEDALDLEASASNRKVFTEDDLELLVSLVKPLVAELKANLTTADDRSEVRQNYIAGMDSSAASAREHTPETTEMTSLIITDYYGSGEEEVIDNNFPAGKAIPKAATDDDQDASHEKLGVDEVESMVDKIASELETIEKEDAVTTTALNQLPEDLIVMSQVVEMPKTPNFLLSQEEENKVNNLPFYMAMTAGEEAPEKKEEVFYLPAGHGLRISFKLGDLTPGRRLAVV
jgi:hypothetical protein